MKPTAVFFTVALLVAGVSLAGCSFNTKDKIRTTTHEIPLKDEKAATAPLPDVKIASSRNTINPELIEVKIKPSICERLSNDLDVIHPPKEEGSIDKKEDDSTVFFMCNLETEAEYPGGAEAWRRFLNKNLKFPTDTSGNGISGTVEVQFVIDEEGNVTDVQVICGLEPLSTEAVRVIKKSGKWIPAKLYSTGRCVRSFKKQPFIFRRSEDSM